MKFACRVDICRSKTFVCVQSGALRLPLLRNCFINKSMFSWEVFNLIFLSSLFCVNIGSCSWRFHIFPFPFFILSLFLLSQNFRSCIDVFFVSYIIRFVFLLAKLTSLFGLHFSCFLFFSVFFINAKEILRIYIVIFLPLFYTFLLLSSSF